MSTIPQPGVRDLTDSQEQALAILPIFSSILSIVGSVTILRLVHRAKNQGPYKRIVYGMSMCDAFSSIVWPLQAFLVPRETSNRIWAVGNSATCTAMGFAQQLSFAAFFYTGMLGFYFLATIRFGVRGDTFAKYFEPWIHALSVGFPLGTAIVGVAVGAYDDMYASTGCWVTGKDNSVMLAWIFLGYPYFFIVVSLIVNNLIIYAFVRRLLRKTRMLNNEQARGKRVQAIATQALLYVLPMAISTVWSTILRIKVAYEIGVETESRVFPLLVLQALFYPAFGFFNMIVFVRPRYLIHRSQNTTESWRKSLRHVLFLTATKSDTPEAQQTSTMQHNDPTCQEIIEDSHHSDCIVELEDGKDQNTSLNQSMEGSYELEITEGIVRDPSFTEINDDGYNHGYHKSFNDLFDDLE